jgi:polysaccharide pyruvyl transferase WcaK-like protein
MVVDLVFVWKAFKKTIDKSNLIKINNKMKKKLIFTGYYGFDNFGDDLFVESCVYGVNEFCSDYMPIILSPPIDGLNCKFLVPEKLSSIYKSKGLLGKILRMSFMIFCCVRYKNIVIAGGSVFYNGGFSVVRLIQFSLSKIGFCQLSAIGVSVGPFEKNKDRFKTAIFLNQLKYLTVRDKASLDECLSLGVNVPINLFNDLAGILPFEEVKKTGKDNNKCIGVSICNYETYKGLDKKKEEMRNYLIFKSVCKFAKLEKLSVNVIILNSNENFGDNDISRKIYKYLRKNNINTEIFHYKNPYDTINKLKKCDFIFSVRLHGGILSYLLNLPFVLFEYHDKCKCFLDYIGINESYRINSEINDPDEVFKILQKNLASPLQYKLDRLNYKNQCQEIFKKSPWAK